MVSSTIRPKPLRQPTPEPSEAETSGPEFEISDDVKLKPMEIESDPPGCLECFPNGWAGNETATAVGCPHGTWKKRSGDQLGQ